MRKTLIASLALAMVLGITGTAFAASTTRTHVFSDVTNAEQAYYLDFLGSLGIFRGDTGPGGPARPNDTISRAEYAVVVVRMLGREGLANMMAGFAPPFGDGASIPAWAVGAVNVLANMNVLRGDESGNFRPNDPVKGAEALAMLTRALGNDAGATGVWPMNYMMWAYDTGLLPEADLASWEFIGAYIPITRAQMALLTYNALWSFRGWDAEDEVFDLNPLALAFTDGGLFTGYNLADSEVELYWGVYDFDLASVVTLYGGSTLDAFMHRYVAFASVGDEVVWIETAPGNVVTGVFKEWKQPTATDTNYYIVFSDGSKVKFTVSETTQFSVNGGGLLAYVGDTGAGVEDIVAAGDQFVCVLDDEGFATYVTVLHEEAAAYISAKPTADTDPDGVDDHIVGTIAVSRDALVGTYDVMDTTTIVGDATAFSGLAQNDVIYLAFVDADTANALYRIDVVRETQTGKVADIAETWPGPVVAVEFESGPDLQIAGTDWSGWWSSTDPAVGQEWTFCLDRDGYGRLGSRVAGDLSNYPLVKITGYQDRSGKDRITVQDHTGAFTTYTVAEWGDYAFSPVDIGWVGELYIAGRTEAEADRNPAGDDDIEVGDVIGFTPFQDSDTLPIQRVYAVNAATGELTLGGYSTPWLYIKNPGILVFEYDPTGKLDPTPYYTVNPVGSHVGLGGLAVGDTVSAVEFDPTGDDPEAPWLIMLWEDADVIGLYDGSYSGGIYTCTVSLTNLIPTSPTPNVFVLVEAPTAITNLEYFEEVSSTWQPLANLGGGLWGFGPDTGFPFPPGYHDATKVRGTVASGTYSITLSVVADDGSAGYNGTVLFEKTFSITIP